MESRRARFVAPLEVVEFQDDGPCSRSLGDELREPLEQSIAVRRIAAVEDGGGGGRLELAQRVDDFEAVRKALDYDRIDLLSESVGTRTAMIYAWRYPESIHRSVMMSVNPPGHFLWDPKTTNELNYAAQKLMRGVIGTNNIDSCNRT